MASEKDLRALMVSRARVWTPKELCDELGVHVCELVRLLDKARRAGANIRIMNNERTGNTHKLWLVEG
ncbi:hypothetical protein C9I92_01180 [Photobacterium ganghwense]|uniref:DNA-binding protein n=1 Tax=Photobacterium ganghwense TaxID=320778 RepID=A0A0J1HAD9_9GAMM|nr:hypothetical protein ABT57_12550 [Photobacterium ganghwense]PSU10774.1 hypothetical protein C9I92_01180 [Photobacterium ganghwense]